MRAICMSGMGNGVPAPLPALCGSHRTSAVRSIPQRIIRRLCVEAGLTPDQFVQLAIDYAPFIVPIGRDLWAWAWPKLRDYFVAPPERLRTLSTRR